MLNAVSHLLPRTILGSAVGVCGLHTIQTIIGRLNRQVGTELLKLNKFWKQRAGLKMGQSEQAVDTELLHSEGHPYQIAHSYL